MIYKLLYHVKTGIIKTLQTALEQDPEFYPDGAGVSRSSIPKIVDGWNYEMREFPMVVVAGSNGGNRREGIADAVDTIYSVVFDKSIEDAGSSTLRIFRVNQCLPIGASINVYNPATTPTNFTVAVEAGSGTDTGKRIIKLHGTAVGPDTTYPLKGFRALSELPTGDRFGGWFNLSLDITCVARNTLERERLADKVLSLIWFDRKAYLRDTYNIHIFDVRMSGETEEKYGTDMLYFANINITCATEWSEVKWYDKVLEGVEVEIAVIDPSLIL